MNCDLLIVGGGPAGCAATIMGASLGLSCQLIEADRLAGKLHDIPVLSNVIGGHRSGPDLASQIASDITDLPGCTILTGRHVVSVEPSPDHVAITMDDGTRLSAPHLVLATGVKPQTTADVDWIRQDRPLSLTALWQANPADLDDSDVIVLGADRPLGTILRAFPTLDIRVLVIHTDSERYKTDEIRDDRRVTLLPATHVDLSTDEDGATDLHVDPCTDHPRLIAGKKIYLNLGNQPVMPAGPLTRDDLGYCPAGRQHPRIHIAGDLRGARYQRIMTAWGSGAEAALRAYYSTHSVT